MLNSSLPSLSIFVKKVVLENLYMFSCRFRDCPYGRPAVRESRAHRITVLRGLPTEETARSTTGLRAELSELPVVVVSHTFKHSRLLPPLPPCESAPSGSPVIGRNDKVRSRATGDLVSG